MKITFLILQYSKLFFYYNSCCNDFILPNIPISCRRIKLCVVTSFVGRNAVCHVHTNLCCRRTDVWSQHKHVAWVLLRAWPLLRTPDFQRFGITLVVRFILLFTNKVREGEGREVSPLKRENLGKHLGKSKGMREVAKENFLVKKKYWYR